LLLPKDKLFTAEVRDVYLEINQSESEQDLAGRVSNCGQEGNAPRGWISYKHTFHLLLPG